MLRFWFPAVHEGAVGIYYAASVQCHIFSWMVALLRALSGLRDQSGDHAIKAHPLPGLRVPSVRLTNVSEITARWRGVGGALVFRCS